MLHLLEPVYRIVTYYLSWLLFGAGAAFLQVVSLLALPFARHRSVQRAIQRLIHGLCWTWVLYTRSFRLAHYRYDGFEKLRGSQGLVVAANHPCLMDIALVLARLPEALCVYKAAIRRNIVLSAIPRAAGYIPNDEGLDLVRHATDAVAAGRLLLVFPEGTRTRETVAINPLKPGFALVAQRAKVPVQLVFIRTRSNALRKGRAWWKLPDLPPSYELVVGPRLGPDSAGTAAELSAAAEVTFRRELADWVARPAKK